MPRSYHRAPDRSWHFRPFATTVNRMNVFITGGTGYLGPATIAALVRAGHAVEALVRTPREVPGATTVVGSLTDLDVLREASARADAVIHLAADYGGDGARVDREAAAAMLDGGGVYIHTGGVWVYGDTDGVADEDAPENPPAIVAWRAENERAVLAGRRAAGDARPGLRRPRRADRDLLRRPARLHRRRRQPLAARPPRGHRRPLRPRVERPGGRPLPRRGAGLADPARSRRRTRRVLLDLLGGRTRLDGPDRRRLRPRPAVHVGTRPRGARLGAALHRPARGARALPDNLRSVDRPFVDLGFARVDTDREARQGAPEAIFAEGKTPEEIAAIAVALLDGGASSVLRHARRCGGARGAARGRGRRAGGRAGAARVGGARRARAAAAS